VTKRKKEKKKKKIKNSIENMCFLAFWGGAIEEADDRCVYSSVTSSLKRRTPDSRAVPPYSPLLLLDGQSRGQESSTASPTSPSTSHKRNIERITRMP
jgi:hypothetical protein